MKKVFAAVDASGGVIGVASTLDGAATEAERFGAQRVELDETLSGVHAEMAHNPPLTPERAHKLMGSLYVDYDRAMRMSLEEAVDACMPYLPRQQVKKGMPRDIKTDPRSIVDRALSQNYKTAKKGDEKKKSKKVGAPEIDAAEKLGFKVNVQGVGLLPHTIWWDSLGALEADKRRVRVPMLSGGTIREHDVSHLNTCAGASKDCKAACLVYSGQNVMDIYSTIYKMAWSNCLIFEPQAYIRILSEAVHRHINSSRKAKDTERFVRLNVLSDIPWELVCPGLIDSMGEYQGRRFAPLYDYTKVPGRRTPKKIYDLTFSFSGTNSEYCIDELESMGRRIAVVFFDRLAENRKPELLPSHVRLGSQTVEVIDGDWHDARATDKPGVVVGLKYKAPRTPGTSYRGKITEKLKGTLSDVYGDYYKRISGTPEYFGGKRFGRGEEKVSAFLVPAYETRDGALITAVVPRHQPDFDPDADVAPEGESAPGDAELHEYLESHAGREVVM